MKKILLSLGMLVVVGAIVAGATIAFFNDTETSTGNIFTAGSIDLKVDHTAQTYNGVDCKTCSVDIYSSTSTKVVATVNGTDPVAFPHPAVEVSSPHPNWLPESTLTPAQWIWATDPTRVEDTTNSAIYTFENKFQWNGTVSTVDLNLAFASDNGYKIILNGFTIVDNLLSEYNYNGSTISLTGGEEALFIAHMIPSGENTLQIVVRNKPLAGNPVTVNPAGLLFKLNIHRPSQECAADSAFLQSCRLWTEKDLETNDTIFNFDDVKPGDYGTDLVSLHVSSNDAYSCLFVDGIDDEEVSLTDPELELLDTDVNGELSGYIRVFAWSDTNNNGVYEGEPTLIPAGTPLMSMATYMNFLPLTGGGSTQYVGLAWCAGAQSVSGNVISCNGNNMGNKAQTDSVTLNFIAYAVQQRNNSNFTCASVDPYFDSEENSD